MRQCPTVTVPISLPRRSVLHQLYYKPLHSLLMHLFPIVVRVSNSPTFSGMIVHLSLEDSTIVGLFDQRDYGKQSGGFIVRNGSEVSLIWHGLCVVFIK